MQKTYRWLVSFLILSVAIFAIVLYTINDNSHFVIIRQDITLPQLPEQFEGYTILQISDLHSQQFGAQEEDLAAAINALDYDLLAVTGDVQMYHTQDMQPFIELLQAINHKSPILFTAGNNDPLDVDLISGNVTEVGKKLQAEGCRLMDRPLEIERNGAHIWFSELYDKNRRINRRSLSGTENQVTTLSDLENQPSDRYPFQNEMAKIIAAIPEDDTLIGITHYPVTQDVLDDPAHKGMLPFDLVLAGHYHGGQFRLPFYGALYVPIPSEPLKGFFPDQRIVSGLYIGNGMQQYVSRGLGGGGPIPFLHFRLFNSPEINLLTLHRAVK